MEASKKGTGKLVGRKGDIKNEKYSYRNRKRNY